MPDDIAANMARDAAEAQQDPRWGPAMILVGRTGAHGFQIRYDEEQLPVVWNAVASYETTGDPDYIDPDTGIRLVAVVGAALDPLGALFRLLDALYDGGECNHCHRPSGFSEDVDALPLDQLVCWTQWDPELKEFRRGCAGADA